MCYCNVLYGLRAHLLVDTMEIFVFPHGVQQGTRSITCSGWPITRTQKDEFTLSCLHISKNIYVHVTIHEQCASD